jgi:hypothetical protein
MACGKIKKKADTICVGELKKSIKIINRKIEPDEVSHTMDMTDSISAYARIDSTSGNPMFNGVNTEDQPTHFFYIRYGYTIEKNYTIENNNNYFIVQTIENLNEENRFLKVSAIKNGPKANQANWA